MNIPVKVLLIKIFSYIYSFWKESDISSISDIFILWNLFFLISNLIRLFLSKPKMNSSLFFLGLLLLFNNFSFNLLL